MRHRDLVEECEALGLKVTRGHVFGFLQDWDATGNGGIRVYWKASTISQTVAGCPRVVVGGRDTHAHSVKEVQWLVTNREKEETK